LDGRIFGNKYMTNTFLNCCIHIKILKIIMPINFLKIRIIFHSPVLFHIHVNITIFQKIYSTLNIILVIFVIAKHQRLQLSFIIFQLYFYLWKILLDTWAALLMLIYGLTVHVVQVIVQLVFIKFFFLPIIIIYLCLLFFRRWRSLKSRLLLHFL
jgi:hypothetical protein